MARAGVNYIHIAKAAEAIKEQGVEPTVDRVREQLGTGSKSTIAPLLKQWKLQNEAAVDVSGLPKDLIEVVKSLYDRVQQDAGSKIERMESRFNEAIDALKQELAIAKKKNTLLTEQNDELTADAKQAVSEIESLNTQIIKYQSDKEHSVSTLIDVKQHLEESKEESRAARESLEHYQVKVGEDRQIEQQQHQMMTQQLQGQVSQLSTQLSELNTTLHEQQRLQNGVERALSEALMNHQAANSELLGKSAMLDALQEKMDNITKDHQQLQLKHERIQKDHERVQLDRASALTEIEHLDKAAENKHLDILALQDKLSLLESDYRLAIEEKSVILGQFKQLQASL